MCSACRGAHYCSLECQVLFTLKATVNIGVNFINIMCLSCQYFCAKKFQSQNVTREKLYKALLYEKFFRKMLMKLTTSVKDLMTSKNLRDDYF